MSNEIQHSSVKLSAEINTDFQLEIEGVEGRFKSRLVGVVDNRLLIFLLSERISQKIHQLFENTSHQTTIRVRGISRGEAFGFISNTKRLILEPEQLLMIVYPDAIQHRTIRQSRRVKCLLPAKFTVDTTAVTGVIADISNNGCHFQTPNDLNSHQSQIIKPGNEILIAFNLPGKEVPKTLDACIRNTYVEEDKIHIGIEFMNVDNVSLKLLDEFIALSFEISPF